MPTQSGHAALSSTFRIGDWTVEPALGLISRNDERVHLEPKVIEVLAYLATRAGEVVSKQELTDAVWQVEAISDSRLTRVIADLRRALGDAAGAPRYLETIPTRGYRVVAAVRSVPGSDAAAANVPPTFKLEVAGRGFPLAEGENILGRGTDVDVRIDSEWVSRHHARIVVRGASATVEDLGSKNGTFLHGERINGRAQLHDGDELSMGRGVMVIRFVTVVGSTRTETSIDPIGE